MLDDKRFDFSLESNLKERLWEQMLEKTKQTSVKREKVSFDSLTAKPKTAEKPSAGKDSPRKDLGKMK
ncbi:MAG: hypothetical protein FWD48_05295 [Oscillospiraceae bacterium]|nr:hypothetical protein [Oscillospiraceae bacterium]